MYIKSIFKYLSFKDKIRFAAIDESYRHNIFLKYKPTQKDIKPYYEKANTNLLNIISSIWFDNDLYSLYINYDIHIQTLKEGNILMFHHIIKSKNPRINKLIHETIYKAVTGQLIINKKLSKKIFKLKSPKESINYEHIFKKTLNSIYYPAFNSNIDINILNNLYYSFSHILLTPKQIYRNIIYSQCLQPGVILKWFYDIRKDNPNVDSFLNNMERLSFNYPLILKLK